MTARFDAILIGAGQAAPALAGRLTAAGMRVAFVERKLFGGTCVNTGCMPTKTLVASAYAAHLARRAQDYGLVLGGEVRVDMARVKARADAVIHKARHGVASSLEEDPRCTVFRGQARFEDPHTVRAGDTRLVSDRIFIDVGGRAHVPALPGVHEVPFLTNSTMLELDVLPSHLVVIGGSYVGLEFAQMYRRFGARVTVVEKGPRLIGHEDEEIALEVARILEREGVELCLEAECIRFAPHTDGVLVGLDCEAQGRELIGSHVLLAVGRRPNTDDLGLEAAGVARDARGYIVVDDQLRTNVPGIWALGDCNGRGAFAHTAYHDHEVVAANLLEGDPRSLADRIPAYALYIDPPLGRVGMSEAQARKSGRPFLVARRPMTRVGRAVEKAETQGFMKILVDAETKQILGASILGTSGDEAIHCVLDLMYAKAPYTTLARAVHIHPTVSELLPTLVGDLAPAS